VKHIGEWLQWLLWQLHFQLSRLRAPFLGRQDSLDLSANSAKTTFAPGRVVTWVMGCVLIIATSTSTSCRSADYMGPVYIEVHQYNEEYCKASGDGFLCGASYESAASAIRRDMIALAPTSRLVAQAVEAFVPNRVCTNSLILFNEFYAAMKSRAKVDACRCQSNDPGCLHVQFATGQRGERRSNSIDGKPIALPGVDGEDVRFVPRTKYYVRWPTGRTTDMTIAVFPGNSSYSLVGVRCGLWISHQERGSPDQMSKRFQVSCPPLRHFPAR
jgi:hypothetical protein